MTRLIAIALLLCLPAIGAAQTMVNPQLRPAQRPVAQLAACIPVAMSVAPRLTEAPPRSFASLSSALRYAETQSLCGVVVSLGAGTYTGEFLVTRDTTLKGQAGAILGGPVRNPSGFELQIEDLVIVNAPDTGVFQGGGRATLRRVSVTQTRRVSSALRSGTAIEVHGGAVVTLDRVTIDGNDGVALYLDGKGTIVHANDLVVRKNRIHPEAKEAFARSSAFNRVSAVEVAGGAELYVDRFDISDNEVIGVLVRNRGAAHLRDGTIARTQLYTVAGLGESFGGTNVMSRNEARVELTRFISTGAGACGLRLARGFIKASVKGEVFGNAIGLCIHEPLPGFDAAACVMTPFVRYYDNSTNVDAQTLSVPDPACAMPDPPSGCDKSGATCPGVPWR